MLDASGEVEMPKFELWMPGPDRPAGHAFVVGEQVEADDLASLKARVQAYAAGHAARPNGD